MLDERRGLAAAERDIVVFHAAGTVIAGEFQCSDCGYGIAVQAALPRCPMCRGGSWEQLTGAPPTLAAPLL